MTDTMDFLFPNVAVTAGVTVRVAASFLAEQSAPEAGRWFWSYHVRIENRRKRPVQLIERDWRIVDGHGRLYAVHGDGVVGEMPLIAPGDSYDYVSGCPLETASGEMSGSYQLLDYDGVKFDVVIPHFALQGPQASR